MTRPLSIALVVPVLDEVEALADLLPKMAAINADAWVFVDGGSHDGTPALLERSFRAEGPGGRGRVSILQAGPGRAVQMNAGTARVKEDILLFLHIDTEISSSHLEAIREAMRQPDIVAGRFDVRLSGAHPAFRVIEFFINLRSRLTRISTGDQAMFVRRDVFETMGGFPDQPLMEDVELSRRLKRKGKIACLRQKVVTSSRRWEKHGILRTVWLMWWLRLLYACGVAPVRLARLYGKAR